MSVPYGELARYVCVYICVHAYRCVCTMEPQFFIPVVLAEGHSASGLVWSGLCVVGMQYVIPTKSPQCTCIVLNHTM